MSLLTFGLGISGLGGGSGAIYEVELEDTDTVEVIEPDSFSVQLEDADFNVKIIQKVTSVTKE